MPDFLSLAGGLEKPSDIPKLLRHLAETAGADGAIFWRLAPGSTLSAENRVGRFFPVASWCRFDDVLPWYYLPADSVTGRAWLKRDKYAYSYVPLVEADETISAEAREIMAHRWRMISCASVPITKREEPVSAVTFYARHQALEEERISRTVALVQQLPVLYALVGDRQALAFLSELNQTLHEPSKETKGSRPTTLASARVRLKDVCNLMVKHFDAIEASVLLTEEPTSSTKFKVQARHWGWLDKPYADDYVAGQGMTGWVLQTGRPLRILDLAKFKEDREWIQGQYEGLDWKDLLAIRKQLILKFKLPDDCLDRDLPMASFVCVPILHGRLLGVVRCCGRNKSPWSYEGVDQRVLELAASFIGGWWEDLLEYVDLETDSRLLKDLVTSVTRLHRKAGELLVNERRDTRLLLQTALEKVMETVPGVNHGAIRLVDSERNDLYYKVCLGPLWYQGSHKEVAQRQKRRFSLIPQPDKKFSAGAYVVSRNEAYIVNDPKNDPFDVTILKEVIRRLYVPIRGGSGILGVLDLGRTIAMDFTPRDAIVAEHFAAQMGLYIYVDNQLHQRLELQSTLRQEQEWQLRTFENLRHQVYGPAGTAAMALLRISQMPDLPPGIRHDVALARGDALRASIMVRSLELFVALASDRTPRAKKERVTESWLKDRLQELSAHQSYLARVDQPLTFEVMEKGMDALSYSPLYCDLNLLEHAVSNLLENARKYSAKNTRIVVYCGSMDHERLFFIAVQNSGLAIASQDIPKMRTRGWRSDEAWELVGDGTGIGLYVVDAIMKAHKGSLQIAATSPSNVNEVRLVFPAGVTTN